ncbi:MAG: AAA-associated domain-containing protein, partial [Chloroflexota bacterium]|nr:AAA-associated domain-containing protein [Chloroflexota bacterium]
LWRARRIPTRAILMVTHNIDEAVTMADRLVVLGANPGHIRAELPGLTAGERAGRASGDGAHALLVDTVYRIMTNPNVAAAELIPSAMGGAPPISPQRAYQTLPHVNIGELTGFIERLHAHAGGADLFAMARDLHMEADDILPLAEAVVLLGFGELSEGDVLLSDAGRQFAEAGVLEEKSLFRRQALASIEILRQIERELRAAPSHRLREDGLLRALEQSFSEDEARRQLDTAIDWGRYAELFAYDDDAGEFSLDEGSAALPAEPPQSSAAHDEQI